MAVPTVTRIVSSRLASTKPPVVIDLGSSHLRCGFAGEARPVHVIPSVTGAGMDVDDSDERRKTKEEWIEALTEAFSRLYTESLQCRPKERRVIVCESMVAPRLLREAVAHVLFHFLQVPSLYMCAGPSPVLYCTGLDTGIVMDVGSRETHALAVYRGVPLMSSFRGAPLGCRAVQDRVAELIGEAEARAEGSGGANRARGRPLTRRELDEVVKRACLVPVRGKPASKEVPSVEFRFSGKRSVTVSGATRTMAVEQALFEGDDEGSTLATLFLDCLGRCPRDCRRAVVQNVVVAGGGAMLPGLCARLGDEIRALARRQPADEMSSEESRTPPSGLENPERYAWAYAVVSGSGGSGGQDGRSGLCVVKVPVRRDLLLWTGASVMSSLARVCDRSLTIEQYFARGDGRLPDWMSLSPADWLFDAAGWASAPAALPLAM